jgi:hypothetical protein
MRSRSLGQEEAHHDAGGVEADGLRIAAARIAAEPSVPTAFDQPLFRDRLAVGVLQPTAPDSTELPSVLTPAPRKSAPSHEKRRGRRLA